MLIPVPPTECTTAREAVSARLDGELSELEEARLDAHLGRCAGCRIYAGQAGAIVSELRRAPLERPETPVYEPRRLRRAPAARLPLAAAAVVAAAAVAGSFTLGHVLGAGDRSATVPHVQAVPEISTAEEEALEQHLLAMLPHTGPTSRRLGPNLLAV